MPNGLSGLSRPLMWFITVVLLAFVGYELYSGVVLKKVGIPGFESLRSALPPRPFRVLAR